jgi:hypothetical protein
MKDGDYGYFGKGIDGYVHYMQTFNATRKNGEGAPPRRRSGPAASNEALLILAIVGAVVVVIEILNALI